MLAMGNNSLRANPKEEPHPATGPSTPIHSSPSPSQPASVKSLLSLEGHRCDWRPPSGSKHPEWGLGHSGGIAAGCATAVPHTIECTDDQSIFAAAADQEIDLPVSCRAASCSSCAGKLISGCVNQNDQVLLDVGQIAAGFILTCVAIPTSDCRIETHAEAALD